MMSHEHIFICLLDTCMFFLGKKIYFLYLSIGEGHGSPLQYSCLENSMDREAWWATVLGIAKSWTRLSDSHSLTHSLTYPYWIFWFLVAFYEFLKNVFWLYTLYWLYVCIFSPFGMLTFHFVVEKLKFDLILVNFCFCAFSLVSRKIIIKTNVEEFLTFAFKTFMVSSLRFSLSYSC